MRKKLPVNAEQIPLFAPLSSLFASSRKSLFGHMFLARLASIGGRAHPVRMFGGRPRPSPVQRPPAPRPGRVRSCPGAGSRYGRRRAGGSGRLAGLGEDAHGRERERDGEANRGGPVDHCCGLRAIRYAAPVALAPYGLVLSRRALGRAAARGATRPRRPG
jgi:hypothetical protein